jgi:hypothetical protein
VIQDMPLSRTEPKGREPGLGHCLGLYGIMYNMCGALSLIGYGKLCAVHVAPCPCYFCKMLFELRARAAAWNCLLTVKTSPPCIHRSRRTRPNGYLARNFI